MLVFAAIAAATIAQAPEPRRPALVRQASATVRIVSGARISADRPPGQAQVRETKVKLSDGSQSTARLIEFP